MRGRIGLAAALGAGLLLSACKEELYTDLTETEANEIVAVLQTSGTSASRTLDKDGQATVFVEASDFSSAVETLKAQGYPKRRYLTMGDVFQGDGFVVSQMEERARFIFAMTEELSRTIAEIDGVLTARVHVVLPTSDPMSRSREPSSASVAIRHHADASTEALQPEIKMLVANSIEGLTYDKVSVVFIPVAEADEPEVVPAAAPGPSPTGPLASLGAGGGALAGGALTMMAGLGLFGLRRALRGRPEAPTPAPPKVTVMPAE